MMSKEMNGAKLNGLVKRNADGFVDQVKKMIGWGKCFTKNNHRKKTVVITYGTFDLLHYGHIEILKRASKLGSKLIVGLSTDDFNEIKGKKCKISYTKRKEFLETLEFVYKVIPESNWEQKITDVKNYDVDIFVMGDDWEGKFDFLSKYCKVTYLPRTIDISTSKLKKSFNNEKE